jgi:hypothetical protein
LFKKNKGGTISEKGEFSYLATYFPPIYNIHSISDSLAAQFQLNFQHARFDFFEGLGMNGSWVVHSKQRKGGRVKVGDC